MTTWRRRERNKAINGAEIYYQVVELGSEYDYCETKFMLDAEKIVLALKVFQYLNGTQPSVLNRYLEEIEQREKEKKNVQA